MKKKVLLFTAFLAILLGILIPSISVPNQMSAASSVTGNHLNMDGTAQNGNSNGVVVETSVDDDGSLFELGSIVSYEKIKWRLIWDYGDGTGIAAPDAATGFEIWGTWGAWDGTTNSPIVVEGSSVVSGVVSGNAYKGLYGAMEPNAESLLGAEPNGGVAKTFIDSIKDGTYVPSNDVYGERGKLLAKANMNADGSNSLYLFYPSYLSMGGQMEFNCNGNSTCLTRDTQYDFPVNTAVNTRQVGVQDFLWPNSAKAENLKKIKNHDWIFTTSLQSNGQGIAYIASTRSIGNIMLSGNAPAMPWLYLKIPARKIEGISYESYHDPLVEGSDFIKGNTSVGYLENIGGISPIEVSLSSNTSFPANAVDQNGDPIPNNVTILGDQNPYFHLSSNIIDDSQSKVDLVINNNTNLFVGDYYVKIMMKDIGDDSTFTNPVYNNDSERIVEQIVKITVDPISAYTATDFNFTQEPQLKANTSSTNTNALAGNFTVPSGYTLKSVISSADPVNQVNDASYFKMDVANNNLLFQKQVTQAGTYKLRVYLNEISTNIDYYKDIQVEVGNSYPTITGSGFNSNYSYTYKDKEVKGNTSDIIGVANVTLSSKEDGNKPYEFSLLQNSEDGTVAYPDSQKFLINKNNGELKYNSSDDLSANTYKILIQVKDAHNQKFTQEVNVTVNKANQDNYQITNNANYPLQMNQEIAITTSGNESGGNEIYTIINGNNVAQISNGNKFKILTTGTFTLQAVVDGNANYNSKTVTKQITISALPTQTNPIKISSKDSMIYGDTYMPTYTGGTGSGHVSWAIENDSGTGAVLNNGSITVTGVGTFTLKVTKNGDANYQSSSDSKIITVNKRRVTVKPKDVTRKVGEAFRDNGLTYNPQPISGDHLGTPTITSKYPSTQQAGRYTDGIQVIGLANPNYEFIYQDGTLIINDTTLPNNGSGYYKVDGTLGKNNWYISDVLISTTGKDGYDLISADGISFQSGPLTYYNDGDYKVTFYLKNSTTGIIAKGIDYSLKIDQTEPRVPTLTMQEINTSKIAAFINALSFGNWMKQGAEVTVLSSDDTSGIDHYEYSETSKSGTVNKTSLSGIVTYQNDVELTIKAKACDKAGNCSEESSGDTLMIDRKAPTIAGVKDQAVYKYYYLPRFVTVTDNGSGLSYAEYTRDGTMAGTIQDNISERIDGVGEYTIQATDNAGNEGTLTFEIVPLPDIDDIDGSDESKEIIDQVQEEYNEIKNQIDDTEKNDIKDWIKDALDKWNDSRKKVVETDDKSAKVEGEGDTNFDPRTELIVDEISEDDVPKLPKKALAVYDVYLRRGTTRIQPDGRIKVYLPYVGAAGSMGDAMGGAATAAEPIVYQIDTDNKVTQLSVKQEGNFVTFITDHLVKYAISDETQEDNENNNCVVGKDDTINTKDDVCGLPNDKGDQPEKQPDGSVNVPDGGKVEFPNGIEIDTPDGAIIHPDGSVTLPDGTEYDPNGNKKDKDTDKDKKCPLEGKDINVDTDNDGKPDLNVDLDGDCIADLNIDTNFDNIPDIDIDTDGDGKPDINVDTNHDGKADLNIAQVKRWIPKKDCVVNDFAYDTGDGFTPYLNIDDDGDGKPDRNIDDNGDGIPDRNIDEDWFDKYGDTVNGYHPNSNIGGANTGDNTKWTIWWILLIMTGCTLAYSQYRKRKQA